MRTLKKALSLVLVLAMVLSLGVSAFAVEKAADFSDYNKVTNKEAVDVLTAIGVINGNTDGSFGPDGNFTRAQAATMISYLTLGTTVANALPASATQFNDVPATHWAAKYVQYCASQGIINGYGDGKFGPDDKLTANQWALMLLGALGYKAANENIGGAGWEIATTRLAITAGVASAEDLTANFNRDLAAKMAFKTLQADLVYYEGGSNININGATISSGAVRKNVESTDLVSKDNIKSGDNKIQFAEQHFPKLTIAGNGTTDVFGRPANNWKLDGKDIASSTTSTPVKTYTTAQKENAIFNDLGANGIIGSVAKYVVMDEIWMDGVKVAESEGIPGHDGQFQATATSNASYAESVVIRKGDNSNAAGLGQGVICEIFAVADKPNHYIMVCHNEYIAKVTGVTKANATTGAERKVTLNVEDLNTTKNFETNSFEKNDYVLVTIANGEVKTAVAAEKVENVAITSYTGTAVTAAGTTYNYNQNAVLDNNKTYTLSGGATYTFYLDSMGNIVKEESYTAANSNYVYVLGMSLDAQGDAGLGEAQYRNVRYIDPTGKISTTKVTEAGKPTANTWYTLSEDTQREGYNKFNAVTPTDAEVTTLSKNSPTVATGIVANANTTFVLKTKADPETYSVYTGITNVPGYTWNSSKPTAKAIVKNGYAVVVFIDVTGGTASSSSADKLVYLLSTNPTTLYDAENKVNYKQYSAIVDGTATTIDVNADTVVSVGLLKVTSYDSYGRVSTVSAVTDAAPYAIVEVADKAVTYSEPVLKIDAATYTVPTDVPVYVIDANRDVTNGDATTLTGDHVSGKFYIVMTSATNPTITAVYFDGTIG